MKLTRALSNSIGANLYCDIFFSDTHLFNSLSSHDKTWRVKIQKLHGKVSIIGSFVTFYGLLPLYGSCTVGNFVAWFMVHSWYYEYTSTIFQTFPCHTLIRTNSPTPNFPAMWYTEMCRLFMKAGAKWQFWYICMARYYEKEVIIEGVVNQLYWRPNF